MRISDKTRIKRGLGLGEGKDYKPWIRPRDFSANSRVHRIFGNKIEREHVLLSDTERAGFQRLEFDERVLDIREQFPLLPITATESIAEALNIKHPRDKDGKNTVMTIDFLVTMRTTAGKKIIAIQCKPKGKLTKRVIEKFQLEKVFLHKQDIDWMLITEKELNMIKCENIARLREYYRIERDYSDLVLNEYRKASSGEFSRVREFALEVAKEFKVPRGDIYRSFQHLLAVQKLKFDMNFTFNWDMPLTNFTEGHGNN